MDIPVRADIYTIGGFSIHTDQAGLMVCLSHLQPVPRQTFGVPGESLNAAAPTEIIQPQPEWNVGVPAQYTTVMF